jgi:hypothetical protein
MNPWSVTSGRCSPYLQGCGGIATLAALAWRTGVFRENIINFEIPQS